MLIVGIEPRAPGLHIFTQAYTPRTGLPRLMTRAQEHGHECIIFCEEVRRSQVRWDIIAHAKLVLISSITSTAPRAYELAAKVREINPAAVILGGGPHFTFEYQEALDNSIDYVFRHWADASFFQWLDWYQSLQDGSNIGEADLHGLSAIGGLAFKIANQAHKTGLPARVEPDSWPTPDFRLVYGYKPRFITLITSEGCDRNCEFCSEWIMHGGKYRSRSPEKVIEDIKFYRGIYRNIPIFFGDDNMAADVKDDAGLIIRFGYQRLQDLCQLIIDEGLKGYYSGQVCLALADHTEVLALLAEVGFSRVYIGYESIQPDNAKATGGKLNFDQMGKQTAQFHEHGIAIHAMWVLGFDNDTLDTVKQTIKACIRWKIDTNQFLVLMPLPGSQFRTRLKREQRIIKGVPWNEYDGHHVVFYPKLMKTWELQAAVVLEAMPKIYSRWYTFTIYVSSNIRTIRRWLYRKSAHPIAEFRSNFVTMALRLFGLRVVKKVRDQTKRYVERLHKLVP